MKRFRFLFFIISIFGGAFNTYSQSYQFNKYGLEQGLLQQYVYTINQDNNGFIWIGTGEGVSIFDGVEFQNFTINDGLAENFISCSGQRQKNVIWYGHNKGGISKVTNGKIQTIIHDSIIGSKITGISVDQDNIVWASTQSGVLIKINLEQKFEKFELFTDEKNIFSIYGRFNNKILLGTDGGLFISSLDNSLKPKTLTKIKELEARKIECIAKDKKLKNRFWIATAEAGMYSIDFNDNNNYTLNHYDDDQLKGISIQNIDVDNADNIWVSSFTGLHKVYFDYKLNTINKVVTYNAGNGLMDYIKTSLIDMEGNAWISTYGEGLAMLKDELFVFYSHETNDVPNDTRSFLFQDSVKWFGLSSGLLKISPFEEVKWKYYSEKNGFKNVAVTSIISKENELFLATDGEGLYRFNTKTEKFTKEFLANSYLAKNIYKLVGYLNELWVATEGGLFKKNFITNKVDQYNTLSGLKHNSIFDAIRLSDGTMVLGSHSNELVYVKDGTVTFQMVEDNDQLMDIVAIEKDNEGMLWLATLGNGVFKQVGDSFVHITAKQGLKSDYCYSIVLDGYGGAWVGHRGGLSRISEASLKVEIFDSKKGIPDDFNKNAVFLDKKNSAVWFGTNKRTIKFNPKKYTKNVNPPLVSVKNVFISDINYNHNNTIDLPYGAYKLKIDFVGISFKNPDGVKFQYFLEGHDLEWSESTTDHEAFYSRISDGEYKFYVKACNTDGFCSEETYAFELNITPPIWKRWWFYLLVIVVLTYLIYFIIKRREVNQKEIQYKLEIELAKRTKEVVKKSDELEEKNKNITDSINYALRIQKSILPTKKLLKEYFPESFVYYQPRDIVSGDFYWYEKIDDKFIIACADCTGHGVPGAFMSMISSTLFKEIAHQEQISEPSQFLYKLDELLKNTLKRTEGFTVHDGLDVSVCVFDINTNVLKFAGAYRPVVIYKNNTLERIKTSSCSIGGLDDINKIFETHEVQLVPGDIVYMFTDGFPDQFGGKNGKKLYIKGFMDLLENSLDLEMDDQQVLLKKFFNDWKGDKNQVDDVLVMGIKII